MEFILTKMEDICSQANLPSYELTLLFNNVSKTYDCPCHGSRFRYDGKCLDGPAPRDLELLDIDLKIQPLS